MRRDAGDGFLLRDAMIFLERDLREARRYLEQWPGGQYTERRQRDITTDEYLLGELRKIARNAWACDFRIPEPTRILEHADRPR